MPELNVIKKIKKKEANKTIKYYYFLTFFYHNLRVQRHNYTFFKLEKRKKAENLNYFRLNHSLHLHMDLEIHFALIGPRHLLCTQSKSSLHPINADVMKKENKIM
jgi:hypothetical protein